MTDIAPRAPSAAPRPAPTTRRPLHVAVALGLGTGVYAFSLATVTALQAETDRALIADRAPVGQAIDLLGSTHDRLASSLELARTQYVAAAEGYGVLAGGLQDLQDRMDRLGASLIVMEGITIDARTLAVLNAPALRTSPRTMPAGGQTAPVGSSTSTGNSSSGGSGGTVAVVPLPPPVAAAPITQATTGASGAP